MGAKLNSLRVARGKLADGVNYLAKSADIKLIESSERSDMAENVFRDRVLSMQKVALELENRKATAIQTKNEIAPPDQKIGRVNGNIKGEVQRCIGSVLHKHTGSAMHVGATEGSKDSK